MAFTLRFVNFSPYAGKELHFLISIIAKVIDTPIEVIYQHSKKVDLEVHSNFGSEKFFSRVFHRLMATRNHEALGEYIRRYKYGHIYPDFSKCKRAIWYTGENLRPPAEGFSGTISYEKTDWKTNNVFFPIWMMRIDWEISGIIQGDLPKISNLLKNRDGQTRPRNACSFSSLREPNRVRLIKSLQDVMTIDEFGKAAGGFVEDKPSLSKQYGYQICSENDLYPNYVTEKLPEAWHCQNIPIWTGLDLDEYFNPMAMLNLTGLNSDQIQARISAINTDEEVFIRSQPLLLKKPTLSELEVFLQDVTS
jgi:hypothetical protein